MGADAPTARRLDRFPFASDVLFVAITKQRLCAVRSFPDPFTIFAPEDQMSPGVLLRAQVSIPFFL